MPAPVVVVHDEVDICEAILRALSEAALDAVGFTNPMGALDAVEKDSQLRVLVTRMSFGRGTLNGLALYRMLDHKRTALSIRGHLRAVFIGQASYREAAERDGVFLLRGTDPRTVVEAVRRQLKLDGAAPLRMASGPIIWEGKISLAAPAVQASVPPFSARTDQLVRNAKWAITRAHAVQQWRMPTRRPFEIRAG